MEERNGSQRNFQGVLLQKEEKRREWLKREVKSRIGLQSFNMRKTNICMLMEMTQ